MMKMKRGEMSMPLLMMLALVTIIVLVMLPVINSAVVSTNVNSAINYLTGQGYLVWAQGTALSTQDITPTANCTYDIGDETGDWYNDLWLCSDARIGGTLRVGDDVPETALGDGEAYFSGPVRSNAALAGKVMTRGSGLWIGATPGAAIEHQGVGTYDHTGGVYENQFTATAPVFTQDDEDFGSFLVVVSGANYGSMAEVDNYIDATTVVLDVFNWTADMNGVAFVVATHPLLVAGAGGKISTDVSGGGHFEIHGIDQSSEFTFKVEHEAGANDTHALELDVDATGYSDTEAIHIDYDTKDMVNGMYGDPLHIVVDESRTTGDVHLDFIHLETTDAGNSTTEAIHIGVGFDSALSVDGNSTKKYPDFGYEVTSGVTVDRVNSGGGGDDAFENPAVNVAIFDSDNDSVLIGNSDPFEVIEYIAQVEASKDVVETYEYSTGVDAWSAMIPENSVDGFQQSGSITFEAPADWALTNQAAGDAISNGYYVRITRTVGGAIPVLPTERTFSIYTTGESVGFEIRGDGTIAPVSMADAAAPNNSIYYSITQAKLVYKDSTGNVHDLW